MATRYLYLGATKVVGRFGLLTKGDVLSLTTEQAADVQGHADFTTVPELPAQVDVHLTGNTNVTYAAHHGKRLVMDHATAAATLTLPAAPTAGMKVEVVAGTTDQDTEVDPNGKEINGVTNICVVDSYTVDAAGSGYTSLPTVAVTGGAGSASGPTTPAANVGVTAAGGATAVPHMKALTAVPVAVGSGYVVGEIVTLAGGTGTAARVTVATVKARGTVTVANGGTGYRANDIVTVSTGTGTKATVRVVSVNESGVVQTAAIETEGAYTVAPGAGAATTGGHGTGLTVTIAYTAVASLTVSTAGDLTALHATPATQGATGGSGTGLTATITYGLLSLAVGAAGAGYVVAPTVAITGGGGSGAAATAVLDTAAGGTLTMDAADLRVGLIYDGTLWHTF